MVNTPVMKAVRQAVSEFSENTSIHGVRYIAENGRRWVERFLWIVTEVVCTASAVYMLLFLLYKFQDNPTMTRVESYFHEVATIPFPAVTICNVNRIFRSRAERLVERLKIPESEAITRSEVLDSLPLLGQLLMSVTTSNSDMTRHYQLNNILRHNNLSAEMVLDLVTVLKVSQPCEELLERCSWEGRRVNCSRLFMKSVAHLGVCCSFNSQSDFSDANPGEVLRTPFFGYPLGLSVLLNLQSEDYFWGPFASAGVVTTLHDSIEPATERAPTSMVAVEREVMIQLVPSVRNASASLRTVAPERRHCLFDDEYPLYPGAPGYGNCLLHCETMRIRKACGCRPLTIPPRFPGAQGEPCGLAKLPCLSRFYEAEREAQLRSLARGEIPEAPDAAEEQSESRFQACGCLAQCDNVMYDVEATTADFKAAQRVRRSFYEDMNSTGRALLHIYFDSETAALLVNDLVSDSVQLMSSLGGIFSLFLGCSFMSGVELLYFFTVRLWLLVRGADPAMHGPGHSGTAGTAHGGPGHSSRGRGPPGHVLGHGPANTSQYSPNYQSPFGHLPRNFTHQRPVEGWGWGSDKPVRPRVF